MSMETRPDFSPVCSVCSTGSWSLIFVSVVSISWVVCGGSRPRQNVLWNLTPFLLTHLCAGSLWAWPYVKETIAHLLERWELRGCEAPNGLALQQERVFSPILCSVEVGGGGSLKRVSPRLVLPALNSCNLTLQG